MKLMVERSAPELAMFTVMGVFLVMPLRREPMAALLAGDGAGLVQLPLVHKFEASRSNTMLAEGPKVMVYGE